MDGSYDVSATWVNSGLTANPSFTMCGAGIDRDTAICGVGLSLFVADSVKAYIDYNAQAGSKNLSHNINASVLCLLLLHAFNSFFGADWKSGLFMRFLWHIKKILPPRLIFVH